MGDQVLYLPHDLDSAAVEDHEVVTDSLQLGHNMRREDHRQAIGCNHLHQLA